MNSLPATLATALRKILGVRGFAGILVANFALGMAYSFVVPFMSMWGTLHVGMSGPVFGTFMTITAVSGIVISTALARWSDTHLSRRTVLIAGAACGLLGYVGYAFVTDVLALVLIGSLLLGTAQVAMSQLFAHMREELARPEHAGADGPFLMSVLRVSFSLAWTFGPAFGAWVMAGFGYRGIFLGAAGLFGVFLAGMALFVPERPHPPASQRPARMPLFHTLTRRDVLGYFLGFVAMFTAFNMSLMDVPLLVTQQLGGTSRDVGIIYSIAPFFEVPLMIWFGLLAARGHQLALLRLGAVAGAVYFAALCFVQAPWHIYPAQVVSAVSIAITTNITITFFQDLLPGQAGLATSIYGNSFSTGSLLGYFLFGLLMKPLGYRGIFVVCVLFTFATIAVLFRRRPLVAGAITT